MRRFNSTLLRCAGLCLLALLLLAVAHSWWLTGLGRLLIRAEAPARADLIVVLAGDWRGNRILKAGELIRHGHAAQALVSGPSQHYGLAEYELAIPFAVRHGYPESYFVPFRVNGNSTREEAAEIVAEIRRRGVSKVMIVTSDFHTGRAGRIYRALAPDLDIRMVASSDRYFRADRWWKTREGQKIFLLEWTKVISSLFGI